MKSIPKIIITTILGWICLIHITGCCHDDTYVTIDENYKPYYKIGDTLIFKNNVGLYDTLFVKTIDKYDDKRDNMDNCGTAEHREKLIYKIDVSALFKTNKLAFIEIDYRNRILIYINDGGFDTDIKSEYSINDSINIEGCKYSNFYNFYYNVFDPKIKLLYDKKYGIVQFSDSNKTWNLICKNI